MIKYLYSIPDCVLYEYDSHGRAFKAHFIRVEWDNTYNVVDTNPLTAETGARFLELDKGMTNPDYVFFVSAHEDDYDVLLRTYANRLNYGARVTSYWKMVPCNQIDS